MKIRRLEAFQVLVELRKPIRHASHERRHNDTLIIRCELADGSVGWGEGLPRTYVTGESIDSVWRHLRATSFTQLADRSFASPSCAVAAMGEFLLANVPADAGVVTRECFGNSVRCALELALLDSVCRSTGCSLTDVLKCVPEAAMLLQPQTQVRYSGVVSSTSSLGQWRSAIRMKLFGFRDVKVKVGAAGISDLACLDRLRRVLGTHVNLRLDANEAWRPEEVLSRLQPLLTYNPTCIEQPVAQVQDDCLRELRRDLKIPVMLDESLCCREDAERAIAGQKCDLFNLRLSKCGGMIPCLRLAALAAEHGLGFQLGCQVGETGILSAAGRHFACNVSQIRYLEGSYGRFLVRQQLTLEDLTFSYGGRANRLSGHGLGITVDERKVREKSVHTLQLIK